MTNQQVICGTFAADEACQKARGIPCGYTDAAEAVCAALTGQPLKSVCDDDED